MERAALVPHPRWRRFVARVTQPRVLIAIGVSALLLGGAAIYASEELLRDGGEGLRRVAHGTLTATQGLELVIFGHSHVATLERTAGGGVYANAGSWLDEFTYLEVTSERISLNRWNGSAEGDRLHALDRLAEKALPHA